LVITWAGSPTRMLRLDANATIHSVDDIPSEARALLAVAPDDFVQERQRLVHALREEGRRADAASVAKLHKPAPVVLAANRAARDRPKAAQAAARAAGRVRKAQLRSDPAAYRDAVAELEDSLNLLADVALAHLARKGKPPSESTRRRLRELLRNAVADDEAREALARGVLREEPETAGFAAFAGVAPSSTHQGPTSATRARQKRDERLRERERGLREKLALAESRLEDARRKEQQAGRDRQSAERAVASARSQLDRLTGDERS
jgi:hypothetical protein